MTPNQKAAIEWLLTNVLWPFEGSSLFHDYANAAEDEEVCTADEWAQTYALAKLTLLYAVEVRATQ
jgi:hypothetical protein